MRCMTKTGLRNVGIYLLACATQLPAATAKDIEISLEECPMPVQATVRQYGAQATFEEIAKDEKKKSGGPAVYEAKFSLPNGKRVELHISPDGKVLLTEEKKARN
jgi:hypothetical protein